jgi:hypothetical protein
MITSDGKEYTHRKNADGSYASFCMQCFRIVAESGKESGLAEGESQHRGRCLGWIPFVDVDGKYPSVQMDHRVTRRIRERGKNSPLT